MKTTSIERDFFESRMQAQREFSKISETIFEARKGGEVVKSFDDFKTAKEWRKDNAGYDLFKIVKKKNSDHIFEESILIFSFENV